MNLKHFGLLILFLFTFSLFNSVNSAQITLHHPDNGDYRYTHDNVNIVIYATKERQFNNGYFYYPLSILTPENGYSVDDRISYVEAYNSNVHKYGGGEQSWMFDTTNAVGKNLYILFKEHSSSGSRYMRTLAVYDYVTAPLTVNFYDRGTMRHPHIDTSFGGETINNKNGSSVKGSRLEIF